MKGQAAWLMGLVLIGGCVQHPPAPDEALTVAIPGAWATTGSEAVAPQDWLGDFGDEALEALVTEAFAGNLPLQAGLARLDQASALARIEGAARWPGVNINGSAQRSTSLINQDPSNTFGLNASVSWELDLWGRVRAQVMGAEADALAAEADFGALRLSLANRVAQAWFTAIEAESQAALALETVTSFEANLATVGERFKRGLSPALDLRLTRANVASARATYNLQKRIADGAIRQLEVLLGRYPSGSLTPSTALPALPTTLPAGVPADILVRRPDITAAYQRLVAADARLTESQRARLPAISLTGRYGRSSNELEDILKDSFDVWSLLGNLTAPVFQGGRLKANVDRADARREENLANYRNIVLTAFREVESALAGETFLREQLAAVQTSADESIGAQELAEERYSRGLVDIITVLESQRRAFNSRSTLINVQNQLLQNRLSLYLALGGGI